MNDYPDCSATCEQLVLCLEDWHTKEGRNLVPISDSDFKNSLSLTSFSSAVPACLYKTSHNPYYSISIKLFKTHLRVIARLSHQIIVGYYSPLGSGAFGTAWQSQLLGSTLLSLFE